ncbi:hypothetical protein [Paractinoplanes rishiriensis]|uniref:Minor tail protein n=1 Tax=Paractinoplanes rishiriensis TaxID=1050105 RepID=A0A919N014_9ACTN|nr:hypothetical protein [Actinoplanes rishiriensis]GIF02234.1 hypothetical protein Ari01nite_96980 [Actinoplanes rishiriensis]
MPITSYPFDGQDTTETQYSLLFRELQDTGIADTYGGPSFQVSATGAGMTLSVQPGFAILRGHAVSSTAVETVTLPDAGTSSRQDRVVLRLDPAANSIGLAVLQGPDIGQTQTDTGIYEMSLAIITVDANVTAIDAGKVFDERRYAGSHVGIWTTNLRPVHPRRGRLGCNTTTGRWEYWTGTAWTDLIPGTADNTTRWNGYTLTVSTSTPSGTPSPDRIWIQPTS